MLIIGEITILYLTIHKHVFYFMIVYQKEERKKRKEANAK